MNMTNPKVHISFVARILFALSAVVMIAGIPDSIAQPTPNYPISYRLFSPFLFNPAIAGSKDFLAVDLTISNTGKANSQVASGNMRISKTKKEIINVHSFTATLKDDQEFMSDFEELDLGSIQRRRIQKIEVADFLITTKIKEE